MKTIKMNWDRGYVFIIEKRANEKVWWKLKSMNGNYYWIENALSYIYLCMEQEWSFWHGWHEKVSPEWKICYLMFYNEGKVYHKKSMKLCKNV